MPDDVYTHGHHASVVASHAARTIANSARYLEPHLQPGRSLIDIGCGPGSITAEFANRLGPTGRVLGIDSSQTVIEQASAMHGASGVEFTTMNLYELDIVDDSFDIAHAHQVLQHLSDPVAALREMARVVRPGGIVAVRDADYAAMHWAPDSPLLDAWLSIYRKVARSNHAEPDAGRHLLRWAQEAGFTEITSTASVWLYATPESRQWWGSGWADRIVSSALAGQAVERRFASVDDLQAIAEGWHRWAEQPDGSFFIVHGELICRA